MVDVSVVVALRNAVVHVPALLDRLDALEGDGIEFVIVDDHSVDETVDLVNAWQPARGRPLQLLRARAHGVAAARNQAVEVAEGEYLWFADPDDTWDPGIVRRLLELARSGSHDIVVCNAERTSPGARRARMIEDAPKAAVVPGGEAFTALLSGALQGHLWNKLLHSRLFDGSTFPGTRAHSDLGGLLRLVPRARSVAFTPEVMYSYRLCRGSLSNTSDYRWEDLEEILEVARGLVAASKDRRASRALLVFAYQQVWLPLVQESLRRQGQSDAGLGATRARARAREQLRWRDLLLLGLLGRCWLAAQGALVKALPSTYRRLYLAYRLLRWSDLDEYVYRWAATRPQL